MKSMLLPHNVYPSISGNFTKSYRLTVLQSIQMAVQRRMAMRAKDGRGFRVTRARELCLRKLIGYV
jgi:hypothetical protein